VLNIHEQDQVRLVLNFDSDYFVGRGVPKKSEFLILAEPRQPATFLADWLDLQMRRGRTTGLTQALEFIGTAFRGCREVEPIEDGVVELCFFEDYILFESMFQSPKGAGEEWDDVLATRDQIIAMIEALLAKQQSDGLCGTFELRGEVLAYGTKAKVLFRDLTGYWDDRAYEVRDDDDVESDDLADDEV
jgi:hypothetical protein